MNIITYRKVLDSTFFEDRTQKKMKRCVLVDHSQQEAKRLLPYWLKDGRCELCKIELKKSNVSYLVRHEQSIRHQKNATEQPTDDLEQLDKAHSKAQKVILEKTIFPEFMKIDIARIEDTDSTFSYYLDSGDGNESTPDHKYFCTKALNSVIKSYFREALRDDVGCKPFSLFLDQINETNLTKKLGIAIRYYSKYTKKFSITYLKTTPLTSVTAESIIMEIENTIIDFDLCWDSLVGIATDNSTDMKAINSTVLKTLREKYEINFFYEITCTCGSFQKILSQACDRLPHELELLVKETFEWFKVPERQMKYPEMCANLSVDLVSKRKNQFCWLSNRLAVTKVCKNWELLRSFFENVVEITECIKAQKLLQFYRNENHRFSLTFIRSTIKNIIKMNDKLQRPSANSKIVLKRLQELKQCINGDLKSYPCIELNSSCQKALRRCSPDDQQKLLTTCQSFVLRLNHGILRCYGPYGLNPILLNFKSLQPALCFEKYADLHIVCFAARSETDPDLIQNIKEQWLSLRSKIGKCRRRVEESWLEIFQMTNSDGLNIVPDLCLFAMKHLCLPVSDARLKCVFEQMKVVEAELKDERKLKTLDNVLFVRSMLRLMKKNFGTFRFPKRVERDLKKMFEELVSNSVEVKSDFCDEIMGQAEEELLGKIKEIENDEMK